MSDSENSSFSGTSESTIEPIQIDKVLEALQLAADDVKETKDYLSYSTILDIYYTDHTKYSPEEREQLLSHLHTVLSEDKELTYEIGWDLPSLVLPYIDTEYELGMRLRDDPRLVKILKIFEVLAHNGNPKELFLKCIELLNTLKYVDNPNHEVSDPQYIKEKYFDLKLYCIFELTDSCLKRITTYYPSRFLAMFTTGYVNLLVRNRTTSTSNTVFMLKRLYNFARNYTSPLVPSSSNSEYSKEELDKIKDDEDYLQRRLLTAFITESVYLVGKYYISGYSTALISHLQASKNQQVPTSNEYSVDIPVLDRLFELTLSYDVDVSDVFKNFMVDAHGLFAGFDYNTPDDKDELSGEIFEKLIIDHQKNFGTVLVNSDASKIHDSALGGVILFTHTIAAQKTFDTFDLTFNDALVMTLRSIVPMMVDSRFSHTNIQDVMVFWSWFAVYKSTLQGKRLELQISKIPKVLLSIYYQALLFVILSNPTKNNFRFSILTLLTRVLSLSPEEIAYSFILDSLHHCPFDNIKVVLVGVLKELLTKEKDRQAINDIANDLAKVDLQKKTETASIDNKSKDDESLQKPVPPPLPSRQGSNSGPSKTKYITLSKSRGDDVIQLVRKTIDEVFNAANIDDDDKTEGVAAINLAKLPALSAYLNLLVVIKDDTHISKESVSDVVANVEQHAKRIDEQYKDDKSKSLELNSIGILKVTLDRIKA